MDKVSIIVPVYNVEKYLKEAIESIINQTYKNIEIILIDDGSTDKSGEICDYYASKDLRIKVIHKENGGLSETRNIGLDNATGKYLMFLDSDDFMELNAVENMYNEIAEKQADYVIGNYINATEEGEKWDKPIFDLKKYTPFKLSITEYTNSFFIMNSSVCNKIFNKKFIDNLGLRFVIGLPAEDAIFTTYCFMHAKNVYYVPYLIFNYRQRKGGSISSSCNTKYFDGINKAYKIIYENFKESNNLGYYRYFYSKSMNYIIYKFIDSNLLEIEDRKRILTEMKWFYELTEKLEVPTCQKAVEKIIKQVINGNLDTALEYCRILQEARSYMTTQEKEKMSKPGAEMYHKISLLDDKYTKKH